MDNRQPYLDTLAFSEIGKDLLAITDNGYNVLVGSTAAHPILFFDYSNHPNTLNHALNSTAAGRYQIIHPTFMGLCKEFGLSDFHPSTQDIMALHLIEECDALDDVDEGNFESAIIKCAKIWASLPGSTANQHINKMASLKQAFIDAGGVCNG